MPGKKVNRKNGRKQQTRRGGFAPATQITQSRVVVFPFASYGALVESVAGSGGYYTFRLNSLYDPDFTGTGVQPLGFDQFSALYGRYCVLKVHYEVVFANLTTLPARVGAYMSPNSTLPSAAGIWCAQPYCKTSVIGSTDGGRGVVRVTGNSTMFRELGVTKQQFQDEADFSATTSASPLRVLYLHLFTHTMAAAGAANLSYTIRMWYTAELSQLVNLTFS